MSRFLLVPGTAGPAGEILLTKRKDHRWLTCGLLWREVYHGVKISIYRDVKMTFSLHMWYSSCSIRYQ